MQVKKQQLELDMEQWTGSSLGKEYVKAVYCHSVYLTSMQSTFCEMPDQMNHKLKSRLLGEILTTSDKQLIQLLAESEEELKSLLMRVKSWLKTQDSEIWHPVPLLHGKYMGEKWKQRQNLFSWSPESLQMVAVAMKLKDACSLEEKL